MKVSKNYEIGSEIMNPMEINTIAKDKKAVGLMQNNFYSYAPAAWVQNWSLHECAKWRFFHLKKIEPLKIN